MSTFPCSERRPADSLERDSNVIGDWFRSSSFVTGGVEQQRSLRCELLVVLLLLAWANTSLLAGEWNHAWAFFPSRVAAGEWWRLLTHPFVHVSWYHLLLDSAAFLMLYAEMCARPRWQRLGAVLSCAFGSLVAALSSPIVAGNGFGGLSGIAHGLMVLSALGMVRGNERAQRCAGWIALSCVIGKALLEAITGDVLLSFVHMGLMGSPVAACHAGGVVGGLLFWLILGRVGRKRGRDFGRM
jgi:rhomboid family GlyGly-CTERM serine protease